MTKRHFIDAAAIVRNIVEHNWTNDPPPWSDRSRLIETTDVCQDDETYTRAVWTAEAFVNLFASHNPRFDTQRFLVACGLAS